MKGGKLFWQYPSACPLNTLFANTMYAHFFIKGGAAYSQQRRRLCQVSFGYGYCRLDLFNVPFLVFLQTSVYLFFLAEFGASVSVCFNRKKSGVIKFPLHINTAA